MWKQAMGWFAGSWQRLVLAGVLVTAAFFAGAAWQGNRATTAAVQAVQKAADAQAERARQGYEGALVKARKAWEAQKQTELAAAAAGSEKLQKERDDARRAYRAAMAQLKGANHGAYPPDDLVIGGADLRRLFNDAAAACAGDGPLSGPPELFGGADDRAAVCRSSADLTLGQLKTGYLNQVRLYRETRGALLAVQAEARRLGVAPKAAMPDQVETPPGQ